MIGMARLTAAVLIGVVGLAACDDSGGFDEAAFCEIAREFQAIDDVPSNEQLDRYVEAAPDEIKDDAEFAAEQIREADGNIGAVFGDPEIGPRMEEAFENIEAAETERCDIDHDDGEDGEDGEDGPPEGDPEPAEGANVVEVTGVEYAFEGVPAEIPAGLTAFGFTNGGEEAHEMFVGKLAEGTTLDDVLAFEGDPIEGGLVTEEVGGTFGEPGSDATYVNAELAPGTYGMVCFVPGPEGKPHAELGMTAEFTVA